MPRTSNSETDRELAFARRAFGKNEWTVSEIVCREILDKQPDCIAALKMLERIARKFGALEQAKAYSEIRLAGASTWRRVIAQLPIAYRHFSKEAVEFRHRSSEDRFLVIKSREVGFWSDVSHVLGCLLLAEITDRIPVIHWGRNCLYGDGSPQDAFRNYFHPLSSVTLPDLARLPRPSFFPPKWTRENLAEEGVSDRRGKWSRLGPVQFLNRFERIAVADFYIGVIHVVPWIPSHHAMHGRSLEQIYSYLVQKYLHVQDVIHDRCIAFFNEHLADSPFIAVHIRGSDKIAEEKTLHDTNQIICDAVAAMPPHFRIFLLTDDARCLAQMRRLYGERIVFTDCQRTSTLVGTHNLPSVNPTRAGWEVMTDVNLALRANQFIGNGGSNVAALIALMKPWQAGTCVLIGQSTLTQRHLSIFLPRNPTASRQS